MALSQITAWAMSLALLLSVPAHALEPGAQRPLPVPGLDVVGVEVAEEVPVEEHDAAASLRVYGEIGRAHV